MSAKSFGRRHLLFQKTTPDIRLHKLRNKMKILSPIMVCLSHMATKHPDGSCLHLSAFSYTRTHHVRRITGHELNSSTITRRREPLSRRGCHGVTAQSWSRPSLSVSLLFTIIIILIPFARTYMNPSFFMIWLHVSQFWTRFISRSTWLPCRPLNTNKSVQSPPKPCKAATVPEARGLIAIM